MPNFDARIVSGATLQVWTEGTYTPPSPPYSVGTTFPSRLNPHPAYPHKYQRVLLGDAVTIRALVNGVDGPLDAALGGKLFTTHFAELPVWPPPLITNPPGQSSEASFTPKYLGHHLVVMRRADGGAIAMPFWVEQLA